jgi:hypothetical protein
MVPADPKLTKLELVRSFIQREPRRTQQEIRDALYGPYSYRNVSLVCRHLVENERFSSTGSGTTRDPFRYYPEKKDA